jgi:alpha-tubulin suppressor-like RCC1 family protein
MTSGAVRCWGSNESGQLGDGTQAGTGPTTPAVGNANRFVAAGHSHTCSAADTEGRPDTGNVFDAVRCWGAQPGPLFGLLAPQPTPAIPLKDVDQSVIRFAPLGIATGESHVCVLGDDEVAGIHCFGPDNAAGQLGTNADPASEAVGIPSSQGARAIAAGDDHACAIWSDGGVRCWGSNVFGELGTGDAAPVDRGVIVQVSGR